MTGLQFSFDLSLDSTDSVKLGGNVVDLLAEVDGVDLGIATGSLSGFGLLFTC